MVIAGNADQVLSWGRCHRYEHRVVMPASIEEARAAIADCPRPLLPFGLGRSYGDSCLNDNGTLIDTRRLDRFISFDEERGQLVCEAGVTLGEILELLASRPAPDGKFWFLPVVPGTRFVTIGGAIANDVHGKNHEQAGSFGCHVDWLEIARSDGTLLRCSADENPKLFRATIGGLGLTGLITAASISLVRVPSLMVEVEHIRLANLDDYFRVAEESRSGWTHHAAWVDVLARGESIGRGIYTRSRFTRCEAGRGTAQRGSFANVVMDGPGWLIGPASIRLFNAVYSRRLLGDHRHEACAPYEPIFFPLDRVLNWNRLYGRGGFYQYQCVVPASDAKSAITAMLETIGRAGQGSFLTVLKELGDARSPGLMSFPMRGTTLAVDFQNRGKSTLALLDELDAITAAAGGRVYPAKDGRASVAAVTGGLDVDLFRQSLDPAFSSTFWRRTAGRN